MADKTKIEWTDATWNVVNGCTVHSPGCTNCYAMKQAHRFPPRQGLTLKTNGGMVWTGEVRFNEAVLTQPLRWKRRRRIFVCAHGDLFHESVPDAWIDRVFAVMALCPQHQFQVLTKRSARMREYLRNTGDMGICHGTPRRVWQAMYGEAKSPASAEVLDSWYGGPTRAQWPLPNVWLGVSVEDQARADERVPDLLATPAAVRWLSCEPLLGPIKLPRVDFHCDLCGGTGMLARWPKGKCHHCNGRGDIPSISTDPKFGTPLTPMRCIDWIVVGGESGPKARPMHPDWARSLRDQCEAAGVPFLFKQWGEWRETDGPKTRACHRAIGKGSHWLTRDGKLHDAREPFSIYHEYKVAKVGKKRAGRLLDGVEHNGFPVVLHG